MIENLAERSSSFTSNAFIVTDNRTALIDPGNEFDVVAALGDRVAELDTVILTHTHPDHVGNVPAVVDAYDVEVWGFDPDHDLVDRPIEDGDTVRLGAADYEALHTPGHKADHLCLYAADPGILFAGDLVFANGRFGRTDLPDADRETLVRSIESVLSIVDEDLEEMHTGHGPSVTSEPYDHIELALQAARV
jgi:hydroxyacylglutathione hydrolase